MSQRNLPLDYLKSIVIVFVVAHHSIIAYCIYYPIPFVPFDTIHYLGNAGPVLDSVRWSGFDYFFRIIDTCMMPLMFFVSGLFVWPSLKRKGSQAFLRDRVVRLGVPYAVAVVLLMPLAFFPSFLMTGSDLGAASFIAHYYSIAEWPASPAWFIWVLLVFNCVLVGLIALVPGTVAALGRVGAAANRHPIAFFIALVGCSGIVFAVAVQTCGGDGGCWLGFGPFRAQLSRIPLDFIYFLAAVGIGVQGVEHGLLAGDGPLARRWGSWLLLGAAAAALYLTLGSWFPFVNIGREALLPTGVWVFAFALTCAALSFAMIAVFLRFANRPSVVFDSLQRNAFGIYIIHYLFVAWAQYALLSAPLPAVGKAGIVFVVALAFSWAVIDAVRRIPAVGRYL
jgi:surface polysaccharide O-acyltransferase-like enzyme